MGEQDGLVDPSPVRHTLCGYRIADMIGMRARAQGVIRRARTPPVDLRRMLKLENDQID